MAIKIGGQDLQKRFINGQEVLRVYKNGGQIRPETVPPSRDYLCFQQVPGWQPSSLILSKRGNPNPVSLEISNDKEHWTDYTIGDSISITTTPTYIRNKSETPVRFSLGDNDYYQFYVSNTGHVGYIKVSGDVGYLLCKNSTLTMSDWCFGRLFRYDWDFDCSGVKLPATQLGAYSYFEMFASTYTTTPPRLPALNLGPYCYSSMFYSCPITTAPELPATTLYERCYANMFENCDLLVTPPKLNAINLAEGCYYRMFLNCSSLSSLPLLSATTLYDYCYLGMFAICTNIKLSETQTGEYQTPYRIPSTGTGTPATSSLKDMFYSTGGAFVGTPNINQTYYTSNTVI